MIICVIFMFTSGGILWREAYLHYSTSVSKPAVLYPSPAAEIVILYLPSTLMVIIDLNVLYININNLS